jgi:hypothetical protein
VAASLGRAGGVLLVFAGLPSLFGSCTTPATEIVAGMTTQIQVPRELKAVGVVIRYGGQLISCKNYPVHDGTARLPSTLGVIPQEEREGALDPVTVTVLGFRTVEQGQLFDDTCVASIPNADDTPEVLVIRSKRLPYIDERILYLPMPLRESCAGKHCAENETCIGGECEDNLVDSAKLAEYRDSLIFGNDNTCFSPERCLPSGITLPAVLTDPATCTFRYTLPPEAEPITTVPGNLNVELLYRTFGTEILDLDEMEGFVFPDANDPLTFRLAENLCTSNYQQGKILSVRAAPVCPAKRELQPICDPELADIQAGLRIVGSPDTASLCAFAPPLTPSESALYVLLDRSSSMADLFGPDGNSFVIQTPLRNPVAAQTRLALGYLPAAASDCTTSSFVTPAIDFGRVEDVRQPIADALGDLGTVLADDPMLYLEAAMTGAYTALGQLVPQTSVQFNRRALVIVGNRDLQAHCMPGIGTPATLAGDALADDGIFTYVTVIEAPMGAEQFGDNPVASATSIAQAGGTQVFDGVNNDEDGLLAVQRVLSDLGSCYYDPPPTSVRNLTEYLSYMHPVTFARTDIRKNPACNSEAAAATETGWGFEGDAIRICGSDCAALRETLTDVAKTFLLLNEPAPEVPIVPTLPCDNEARFDPPVP